MVGDRSGKSGWKRIANIDDLKLGKNPQNYDLEFAL